MLLKAGFCPVRASEPVQTPMVGAIGVEITEIHPDAEKLTRIAENLIVLEEGKPFSGQRLVQSIEALKRSGLFSAIDVPDPDSGFDPLELIFRLVPFARVKNIRIHGGFPLLEREVLNAMTIVVGDACAPEKIKEQRSYVESLYEKEGYINPEVLVSSKESADGHCILDVHIEKGRFYRVDAVRFDGNTAFSNARLKMRLSTWHSSLLFGGAARFVPGKLEEDTAALKKFYRGKGHAEADVKAAVEKDPDTAAARVTFTISEGPRYRVEFKGNEAFWNMTLKKDLVLFTEGYRDGLGLRKSIRNMKKRYREKGYPDADIRIEESEQKKGKLPEKHVEFVIREGPQHVVESVSISGNRAFDDWRIREQMLTAPPGGLHSGVYVAETLQEDLRAINALYAQSGYGNADISQEVEIRPGQGKPETVPVFVQVHIDEGSQTMVGDLEIEGGRSLIGEDQAVEMLEMKPGTPFRQYLVKTDQTTLAAAISEKGYPHVTVEPQVSIQKDKTLAKVSYVVDPGPEMRMGETFFTGNFKTRPGILAREVELRPGEPFALSRLLASQRNIRRVNAVETARFQTFGLEEKTEQVHMLAEIQEIKPYYMELATGYDTRRLFYVNAAAGNLNLLGLNKELRAGAEWSQIGYRADLDLNEPRFLGTRISAGASLYTEETEELNKDFGIRIHGASLGFSRLLTPGLTANLNFRFESRQQYRTDAKPVPQEEVREYSSRSIVVGSPGLVYSSTDSFLRPTRGLRATASVDVSRGIENSLDDFFRYRVDGRYYYTPLKRLTLAFHGRISHIDPYGGNERVAEDQLFFLGGTVDVRGFSENKLRIDDSNDPVGGRTAILGSAEARFDIGMNFELAVFYDTGSVRNSLKDGGDDDFRSSAGLGLRYITPIGPIGAMYGWKLGREPGESPGAFHFAIGYTF